jgi:hypothetical protein
VLSATKLSPQLHEFPLEWAIMTLKM